VRTAEATVCVTSLDASTIGIGFRILAPDGTLGPERVLQDGEGVMLVDTGTVTAGHASLVNQYWAARHDGGGTVPGMRTVDLEGDVVSGPACPAGGWTWQTCSVAGSATSWAGVGPFQGDAIDVPHGGATVSMTALDVNARVGTAEVVLDGEGYTSSDDASLDWGGIEYGVAIQGDEATTAWITTHIVPDGAGGDPTLDTGLWVRSVNSDGAMSEAVRLPAEAPPMSRGGPPVYRTESGVAVIWGQDAAADGSTEAGLAIWIGCCN
jgi:hypothetical protein